MHHHAVSLVAVLLAGALAGCTAAPQRPLPQAVEVPLASYLGVLPSIDVRVDGETLPFLFDTGGGITIVTPAIAEAVGCRQAGRITGHRFNGERLDLPGCGPVALASDATTFRADAALFDLMALLPPGAATVGGLVALDALADRPWTLDLAGGRLLLETPESFAGRTATMRPVRVRAAHEAGGAALALFLAMDTPQGAIWLEVDSGNTGPVILAPHAAGMLGIQPTEPGKPFNATLPITGFGPVSVQATVSDAIYDGLLNADFLRRYRLSVSGDLRHAWLAESSGRTRP